MTTTLDMSKLFQLQSILTSTTSFSKEVYEWCMKTHAMNILYKNTYKELSENWIKTENKRNKILEYPDHDITVGRFNQDSITILDKSYYIGVFTYETSRWYDGEEEPTVTKHEHKFLIDNYFYGNGIVTTMNELFSIDGIVKAILDKQLQSHKNFVRDWLKDKLPNVSHYIISNAIDTSVRVLGNAGLSILDNKTIVLKDSNGRDVFYDAKELEEISAIYTNSTVESLKVYDREDMLVTRVPSNMDFYDFYKKFVLTGVAFNPYAMT